MHPEPIFILGIPFHLFGIFSSLSIILGYLLITRELRRSGIEGDIGADYLLAFLLPAFFTARAAFVVSHWNFYAPAPLDVLKVWEGGLVLSGGLMGGAAGVYLFCLIKRLPFGRVADATAPGLALGLAVSRLGCWFAGCCYGRPSHLPWAVTFKNQPALSNVPDGPLHPTQLYAFLIGIAVFAALLQLRKRKTFEGEVMLMGLTLIAGARMFLDLFRGDVYAPMSVLALSVFLCSLILYVGHKSKQRRNLMRVRNWGLLTLVLVVALNSACLIATDKAVRGHNLLAGDVATISKGVTTEKGVIKLFGPPTKVRDTDTGSEYLYEYAQSGGLRWTAIVHVGGSSQVKSLVVWFDKNGVVEDYAYKVN